MKHAIKTISLGLLITAATTLTAANAAPSFEDVQESNQYFKSIEFLKELGVVSGNPNGTFTPKQTLNRAAFAKIIVIASDKDLETEPTTKCFEDVELNIWYTKYVCRAKELGLVKGDKGEGKIYRPEEELNMAEILAVLSRAYEWNTSQPNESQQWYEPLFTDASNKNLLDQSYKPDFKVSREVFSEIVARTITVKNLSLDKFTSHDQFQELLTPQKDSLSLHGAKYRIRTTYRTKTLERPTSPTSPIFRKGS